MMPMTASHPVTYGSSPDTRTNFSPSDSRGSIFSYILGIGGDTPRTAIPVAIKYISCPHCGTIGSALVLAMEHNNQGILYDISSKIKTLKSNLSANSYSATDSCDRDSNNLIMISNPVKCPNKACNTTFWISAAIIKRDGNHVKPIICVYTDRKDAERAGIWPHRGVVAPGLILVRPPYIEIYDDIDDFINTTTERFAFTSLVPESDNNEVDVNKPIRRIIRME